MSRKLFLILLPVACSLAFPAELPIDGIAYVGFRVSNIEQARGFYEGVLGLEEAFRVPSPDGPAAHYFKVNDDQFVRLTADLKPGQDERLVEIGLQTSDIKTLRRMLVARGLQPAAIVRGDDGSAACALTDPDGHRLRFLQYLPGSLEARSRGKHLSSRRASTVLRHTGVSVRDEAAAMAFYAGKLGCVETWRGGPDEKTTRWVNLRLPGRRGDYIELMLYSAPPNRQRLGSMHHICLEVPSIQPAYRTVVSRGVRDEERRRPKIGRNHKWLFSIFDPDGTRTEFMEPKTVE